MKSRGFYGDFYIFYLVGCIRCTSTLVHYVSSRKIPVIIPDFYRDKIVPHRSDIPHLFAFLFHQESGLHCLTTTQPAIRPAL